MIDRYSKLIFIDLETTGPNPAVDRITEIGIVEVSAQGVRSWSTLVNPQTPIPPFISRLTGISDDMVRDAPTFGALEQEVRHRLQDGLFIAHNARFDYGFLRNAFKRIGTNLHCEVLCTVKLSRKLFPNEIRHSLDALIERYGLRTDARHRALADADLLWQFWRKLEQAVPSEQLHAAAVQLLQRPNLPEHLDQDLLDDLPDTPGVYIFYGEHDVPLHVGRAAQLRQRVLSHFQTDRPSYKDQLLARQLRRIDWQETVGEIGAQLLETRLMKTLHPVHDDAGRHKQGLCAWQLRTTQTGELRPVLTYASEQDFGRAERLYGLFTTREKAQMALRALAGKHALCTSLLGLENTPTGSPCPMHASDTCTCMDLEASVEHALRLEQALSALKLLAWPYPGPVALVESAADGSQEIHLVDNWCCLGSTRNEQDLWPLLDQAPAAPAFDLDTYRIVSRALAKGKVRVRRLQRHQARLGFS